MSRIRELEEPSLPPSLWATTATPSDTFTSLAEEARAQVAVIGGGFTGLSTALHAAENGLDVVLLEAAEPGWGASGRNGGQVIPGLKYDPDDVEAMFGADLGPRVVRTVGEAADVVFQLVARHAIACDARQAGWIQPAFGARSLAAVARRSAQWAGRGVAVRRLDRAEVARLIGGGDYVGGWLDPRGGGLQPLSYARGLAQAAERQGARLYARSQVSGLAREGSGWRVATPGGAITAERVVLATNGYTGDGLWPGLAKSVIPLYSFQIATRPLSENLRRSILPEGHVASDTRRLLRYFRLDGEGRLIMGGRSPFTDRPSFEDGRRLRAWIEAMFPQIGQPELDYVWSGRIAMTADHLPHLHVLAPGLYAGLGFNGRGVAMGTQMGRFLAALAAGAEPESIDFPITAMTPIAFHALHRPVLRGLIGYYRLRDLMEANPGG